jgi:hypothetical protein
MLFRFTSSKTLRLKGMGKDKNPMKVINLINTEEIRAEWIPLNDAAELTGLTVGALRREVKTRKVKTRNFSNKFWVRPKDVNQMIIGEEDEKI